MGDGKGSDLGNPTFQTVPCNTVSAQETSFGVSQSPSTGSTTGGSRTPGPQPLGNVLKGPECRISARPELEFSSAPPSCVAGSSCLTCLGCLFICITRLCVGPGHHGHLVQTVTSWEAGRLAFHLLIRFQSCPRSLEGSKHIPGPGVLRPAPGKWGSYLCRAPAPPESFARAAERDSWMGTQRVAPQCPEPHPLTLRMEFSCGLLSPFLVSRNSKAVVLGKEYQLRK